MMQARVSVASVFILVSLIVLSGDALPSSTTHGYSRLRSVNAQCNNCKAIVESLQSIPSRSFSLSPTAALETLCDSLPPEQYMDACTKLYNALFIGSELSDRIRNGESPDVLCTQIGECTSCCSRRVDQVRVRLTRSRSDVLVQWTSTEDVIYPYVEYSPVPVILNNSIQRAVAVKTIREGAASSSPSGGDGRADATAAPTVFLYTASLHGLVSQETFFYRIVHEDRRSFERSAASSRYLSPEFHFQSPPGSATPVNTLNVSVTFVSNIGPDIVSSRVMNTISKSVMGSSVDLIVHAGGLCSALYNRQPPPSSSGQPSTVLHAHLIDIVQSNWQTISSSVPIYYVSGYFEDQFSPTGSSNALSMPRPPLIDDSDIGDDGNGDGDSDMDSNSFSSAFSAERLIAEATSQDGSYGAVDYGFLHLVFLSSEEDLSPDSAQMQWLLADLAAVNENRLDFPWVVVVSYRPLYSSAVCTNVSDLCAFDVNGYRMLLDDVLHTYKVDLFLFGQGPGYERSHPVFNNHVDINLTPARFPVHVSVPTTSCESDQNVNWVDPPNSWSFVRSPSCGYLETMSTVDRFSVRFRSSKDNQVIDEFVLSKPAVVPDQSNI